MPLIWIITVDASRLKNTCTVINIEQFYGKKKDILINFYADKALFSKLFTYKTFFMY